MSAGGRQPWSRAALALGVLSFLGALGAIYYGASIALALLALLLAVVGRVRGERSVAALVVPLLGVAAGATVYVLYLRLTAPDPAAGAAIEESFSDDFDDSFNAILGDAGAGGFGAGFGAVDAGVAQVGEDGGAGPSR